MEENNSIEVFRLILRKEYSEKGVIPPESGSEDEKQIYMKWLKGKEILKSTDNGSF